MPTINERNQHKEAEVTQTKNSREDNAKQNRLSSDIEKGDTQNAVDDQGRSAENDTDDSRNKTVVSLRRRSKYFRNDTL